MSSADSISNEAGKPLVVNTPKEIQSNDLTSDDVDRLYKRAVDRLTPKKRTTLPQRKFNYEEAMKADKEWRNSPEIKNLGKGFALIQGKDQGETKTTEDNEKNKNNEPSSAPVSSENDGKDTTPPEVFVLEPLKTDYGVGIVSDPTRIEQEIGGLAQHDRSREKSAKGWKNLLSLVPVPGLFKPGEFARNFVQNTLLKGSFDARSMGFSRSMMEIARTEHAGLDSSIPLEMPQEILDKSIEEGRKLKNAKSWLGRLGLGLGDVGSGLTGWYENSDMRYAEKWFKENGKELIEGAKKTSLSEQTELGERFALRADNKDVISNQVGETRFKLDEVITEKPVRDALQTKIKDLVASYAKGTINEEELLKQFNVYYHKEVLPHVSADKQKEITGTDKLTDSAELSTNILRIAQEMKIEDKVAVDKSKTRYERYQDEKADDGEAMWNKLHFDVYLGKGKYEVSRGEVKLSKIEKNLIHSMTERKYKIANDLIKSSALELAKDIGIYGGAYLLGSQGLGMLVAKHYVPGLGVAAMIGTMAGREGGLISKKGKLYGWRGKAVNDFEQVSRETASGRKSKEDAKLRPMFEKAMVDQAKATDLIGSIDTQLQKETLNEGEQKQLLQALAHAKARLILTDLSTKKGKFLEVSVAQNFIGFSADNNNAEMTALRARIIQGGLKLGKANPELYGKLNDCQAVYESQLRVGSFEDKVIAALAKDNSLSLDEARAKFANLFENLGIDNKDRKSLEASAFTLAKLVDKKALTTGLFAVLVSPIIGTEMKGLQEVFSGAGALISGHIGEWTANWSQVIAGGVPLTYDANHNLQSGLSPLQKDVLAIENFIKPPSGVDHIETIDGVQVVLPGGVEHGFIQGHPEEDALINTRTGEVLVHMDRSTLFYDDKGELMLRNDVNGATGPASVAFAAFEKNGIHLVQDPNLSSTHSGGQETVFHAGQATNQGIDLDGDGKTDMNVSVPANSHWIYDPISGKYDLQTTHNDGTTINVVENATINANGEISGGTYNHSIIQIDNGNLIASGNEAPLPSDAISGKEIWEAAADIRVVHAHAESTYPINNQTFPTGDTDHPFGVKFTFPEHTIHNPNTGATESLAQAAENNLVGLFLQIPHYGQHSEDVGIFVPAHFDVKLDRYVVDFDPTDTETMIKLPDGSEVSMANLSQNFLNEAKLVEYIDQNNGPGILGSETWYEGREFFNLANPDGDIIHQGRILGGYMDPTSKDMGHGGYDGAFIAIHAVHGSSPVNLAEGPGEGGGELPPVPDHYEPVITIGDINKPLTETVPGYRINYDHTSNPLLSFLSGIRPIPIRENVEKSVRGKAGTPVTTVQSAIPTTPTPTSAPQSEPEEPKDEARKKLEEIAEESKKIEKLVNLPVIEAEILKEGVEIEGKIKSSALIKYSKELIKEDEDLREYEMYTKDGEGYFRAIIDNPGLTVRCVDELNKTLTQIKADKGIKLSISHNQINNVFLIGENFYKIDISSAFVKVDEEEEKRIKEFEWLKNI